MKLSAEKIKKLKDYFAKRDDVMLAFLFGSQAKGTATEESDADVAVYFKPADGRLEFEADTEYPAENEVWGEVERILGLNTDLVALNRASANIAESALLGTELVIKDRGFWLRFMLVVTKVAEEFRWFVNDWYKIAERSRSLSPPDKEELQRKIQFVEEQMSLYVVYRQFSQREFEGEIRKRNEIERWLENITNAIIDISKIVLGSQKRSIPPTYKEVVSQAVLNLKLPEDSATVFEQWIKLRNALAHEYLDIKWKHISDFTGTSEPKLRQFIDAVKQLVIEGSKKNTI